MASLPPGRAPIGLQNNEHNYSSPNSNTPSFDTDSDNSDDLRKPYFLSDAAGLNSTTSSQNRSQMPSAAGDVQVNPTIAQDDCR